MRTRPLVGPAMLSLALLLAGCGGGSTESATSAEPTTTTSRGAATSSTSAPSSAPSSGMGSGAAEVPPFLDFTAETVRGGQLVGADYAGQDLVLWFWAPW